MCNSYALGLTIHGVMGAVAVPVEREGEKVPMIVIF
jgi:hypothetical protein